MAKSGWRPDGQVSIIPDCAPLRPAPELDVEARQDPGHALGKRSVTPKPPGRGVLAGRFQDVFDEGDGMDEPAAVDVHGSDGEGFLINGFDHAGLPIRAPVYGNPPGGAIAGATSRRTAATTLTTPPASARMGPASWPPSGGRLKGGFLTADPNFAGKNLFVA